MGKNILVLCLGNVNRSPACAAVLRQELVRLEPSFYTVTSAGFINPGRRAAKKMRDAMGRHGYDLSAHRSQLVTQKMCLDADYIIYMDQGNLRRITDLYGTSLKTRCLALWSEVGAAPTSRGFPKVPDPAFMKKDSPEFAAVVKQIVLSSRALAKALLEKGGI